MPRLPVGHRAGAVFLALAWLAVLCAPAQARIVVRSAKELENTRAFEDARQEYVSLSAANVIFAQCAQSYPSVATDQPYLAERFPTVEKGLAQTYHGQYTNLVGYPPPQPFVDEYLARIRQLQQSIVNDTALSIRDQGCDQYQIRTVVEYVAKAHAIANANKNTTKGNPS